MKILWILFVWPEPRSSAAGGRVRNLIEICRKAGHEVHACSPCNSNQYRDELESSGIRTLRVDVNSASFDREVEAVNPDIVIFDRFMIEEQFGWRVRAACPNALRVLDTIDLHSLRRARQKNVSETSPLRIPEADLFSEDAFRELASMYRCDLSLITSDAEARILEELYHFPISLLGLVRMGYSEVSVRPRTDFSQRKHLVTIGNFNHPPNLDSFFFLKNTLWKPIRNRFIQFGHEPPDLHIFGSYAEKYLRLDDPRTGFRILGRAEDAIATLENYRLNLAPLRFGAGIKGKVLDGWAAGTPCIASPVAAEGIHGDLAFGGIVADTPESFVDGIIELYGDEQKWNIACDRGLVIMSTLFDQRDNADRFLTLIENGFAAKESVRKENFIGAMLWHHQHRSTEFFSRWIEEKNRAKKI